jgi:hypothetical protein
MMKTAESTESNLDIRKLIAFATVVSGLIAAYMMYRRGASLPSIAKRTVTNPVGSLISEVKNAG